MKLQDEISTIVRGRFLEIARVDNLEPMAIGQLMENARLQTAYLQSVRAKIEENRANIPPDQWLPIQAFLDRQFPVVQDVKEENHE